MLNRRRQLSQFARPFTMEDQYQRVIREPPPECKPASAALGAELCDQKELQGNAGRFQWCDPAKYTEAIARATLQGRLNKQVFDSIVAHIDYDLGDYINPGQNESSHTALVVPRMLQRHIENPPVRDVWPDRTLAQHTPLDSVPRLRMSPPQVSNAHQPYSLRDNFVGSTGVSEEIRQQLDPFVNTEPYPPHPDDYFCQNRSRRANPPRQEYARPDYSRSRNHDFGRRSHSPSTHDYRAPTDRRDRKDRRNRNHATKNRRGHSLDRHDQFGGDSRRTRYRDRDHPSSIGNTRNRVPMEIDPVLLAPETTQEPATHASSTQPHSLPSALPQKTTTRDSGSAGDVVHAANDGEPESNSTHSTPAPQSPSTHDGPCCNSDTSIKDDNNNDKAPAASNATTSCDLSSTMPSISSATEKWKQKNQYVICLECWLKGSTKCDGEVVCGECSKAAKPCTYIRCPSDNCAMSIKCPAYHHRGEVKSKRLVGSPLHWMALLRLRPRPSPSLEVSHIQELQWNEKSAQSVYLKIKGAFQENKKAGKRIDSVLVKALIVEHKVLTSLHQRALLPKVNVIVSFVAEMKNSRYKALYPGEVLSLPGPSLES